MTDMANGPNWPALLVFVALVAAAAALGMVFRPGEWYAALDKPSWTPPNWIFSPVWTVLYLAIAVAGWLIWSTAPRSPAMALWAIQLLLNATWSWLFFGLHRMDLAFYDISLLWLIIAAFIVLAWPVGMIPSLLFVPYLVWVSYAGALNGAIWRMNA